MRCQADRLALELCRAQIFHFIGHGSEFMTGTALILPGQAMFTSQSINPTGFREMKLVVLSACSTARGRGQGLLDPDSLVHGFLAAGARGVIASRWDVDSSTTATLMRGFYENIAAGDNVAEAFVLRAQTCSKQINSSPSTGQPLASMLAGQGLPNHQDGGKFDMSSKIQANEAKAEFR